MNRKIILKSIILLLLTIGLIVLLVIHPNAQEDDFKKVTIMDKYYGNIHSDTATGIKSGKKIKVSSPGHPTCAMEFSNGKILEMDCDTYVKYSVGEKVNVHMKEGRVTEISRK